MAIESADQLTHCNTGCLLHVEKSGDSGKKHFHAFFGLHRLAV